MLDIHALEPHFARAFGDGRILREWFSTLLLYSNAVSLAGPYSDFGAIGGAALDMLAERSRRPGGIRRSRSHSRRHADAAGASGCQAGTSRDCATTGFRMVTLTNSAPAAVEQQLKNAGLTDLFERSFSVDAVKRFKPAPEPYRQVAQGTERRPSATYGWSPRTRGIFSAHFRPAVAALSSRVRARCCIRSARSRTS